MDTAGVTHDVVLDGHGYMLAAGKAGAVTYKKIARGPGQLGLRSVNAGNNEAMVGASAGRQPHPFRRLFWQDWRGAGQRLSGGFVSTRQAGLVSDLTALRPVLGGQALALCPAGVTATLDSSAASYGSFFAVTLGLTQVVAVDAKLFVATGNVNLSLKATVASAVTGMCVFGGQVLVTVGGAIQVFDPVAGTLTAFSPAQPATLLTSYQGALIAANNRQLYYYLSATGAWTSGPVLETSITAFCELEGSLYIGTSGALYRLDGQLKASNPSAAPTTLNQFEYKFSLVWRVTHYSGYSGSWSESNFVKMTAWRGALWFLAAGQLFAATPGATGQPLRFAPQPVYGSGYGLEVCGPLLVVCVNNGGSGNTLWANDGGFEVGKGEGWFKLSEAGPYRFPFGIAGYSQGVVNAVNTNGGNYSVTRFLLDPASPLGFKADNYGVARSVVNGSLTLPVIMPEDLTGDAGGQVQAVQLLRVGLEWTVVDGGQGWPTPDSSNTANSLLNFQLSTDGGQTFSDLTGPVPPNYNFYTVTPGNFAGNRVEFPVTSGQAVALYPASATLDGTLTANPVPDAGWVIRVNWLGQIMPLIRRVWLDYRASEVQQASGLAWECDLTLTAPVIGLDGQADPEAAQARLTRLWNLWQSGQAVTFQDLDSQAVLPSVYTVKVVGLTQQRVAQGALPNLPAGWVASLKLEEVFEASPVGEQPPPAAP